MKFWLPVFASASVPCASYRVATGYLDWLKLFLVVHWEKMESSSEVMVRQDRCHHGPLPPDQEWTKKTRSQHGCWFQSHWKLGSVLPAGVDRVETDRRIGGIVSVEAYCVWRCSGDLDWIVMIVVAAMKTFDLRYLCCCCCC